MTEQAQAEIGIKQTHLATLNEVTMRNYNSNYDGWERNKGLRAAIGLPPDPEPIAFIRELDVELAGQIFDAWEAINKLRGTAGLPALPGQEEPDYLPAIKSTKYVRPAKPVVVKPGQPTNPLGQPMDEDGINFAPAPGDELPNGSLYTTADGSVYRKLISAGFGGVRVKRWTLQG